MRLSPPGMFSVASLGHVDEVALLHAVVDVGAGDSKKTKETKKT